MRTPIVGLCAVAFLTFTVFIPGFASSANISGILVSALPLLLLATGQTFVLIAAGIDLSATAIVGLASVVGGLVMRGDGGFVAGETLATTAALAAMLATGVLVGLVNGLCVGALQMPAFMVTLATGMFVGGLSVLLVRLAANMETIFNLPQAFIILGALPAVAGGIAFGGAVAAEAVLQGTRYGRMLRAVGYNPRAALVSGVPVRRVTATAYVLSGVFAALAAVLLTGGLETASPTHGRQLLLDVIGATVIGGTSLAGGRGNVWGTAVGVLFLAVLGNGLTLLNLSDFVITIFKGLLIVVAAIADVARGGR
ncbi:MAG: ABC transporter permease [Acidobacteriota bacterium]|nr:ABC transporter permease [Acidobacteriota bacterium]